jgi:hypothetical protein
MYVGGEAGGEPRFTFAHVVFNSYHDDDRAEVERQSQAFAEDLGSEGIFMEPFEASRQVFADSVRSWTWPDEVHERLETDGEPIILVVRGRLTRLDPENDQWAIIWLSDFEGTPYSIKPLFQALAKTKKHEDVIGYLSQVAKRRERRGAAARAARVFGHVGGYIDWKPSIPLIGVGIDVKAILADIAEAATRQT